MPDTDTTTRRLSTLVLRWLARGFARGLATLCLLLLIQSVHAEVVSLSANDGRVLSEYAKVWVESPGESRQWREMWRNFVQTPEQWRAATSFHKPLFRQPAVWYALEINNPYPVVQEALLVLASGMVIDAQAWLIADGQLLHEYRVGSQYPFTERPIVHRYYPLPFVMTPEQNLTVLLRVSGNPRQILDTLQLWEKDEFFQRRPLDLMLQWLYYGVMLIVTAMSLGVFALLRNTTYLWYATFVASSTLMFFVCEGFGFMLLWPENTWLEQRASLVFALLPLSATALFASDLLNMRQNSPRIHRLNQWVAGIYALCIVLVLVLDYSVSNSLAITAMIVALPYELVLMGSALRLWRLGNREAGYYFWSWGLYFFLMAVPPVAGVDLIKPTVSTALIAQIGHTVLAMGLFTILLLRIASLMQEEQKAKAESQAKSDFLARMSHEIRTPMSGVLGMADLLAETPLDNTQKRYTEMIRNSGKALLAVINDILDSSKIAAGKMRLDWVPTPVEPLVNDCADMFALRAKDAGLEFIAAVDPAVPKVIESDPTRLRQIIINLLGNAFKFTEHGEVELLVEVAGEAEPRLLISVRDTGIGIPLDAQERLFDAFSQVDSSTSRKYGGTGLGLAISQQLAELMGGSIRVISTPNKGSMFIVDLACKAQDKPEQPDLAHWLSGKQLLLVSAHPSFRRLTERQLRGWGAQLTSIDSPEQVVRAVRQSRRFDAIILDGWQLAQPLNHLSQWRAELHQSLPPVLFLHSQLSETLRASLTDLEAVQLAERPVSLGLLLAPLCELLGVAQPGVDADSHSEEPVASRCLNILMAEDNPVNQTVFRGMLTKLGHRLTIANNGRRALEIYQTHVLNHDLPKFDVLLMDCEMPEMDGFEATRRMRRLESENRLVSVPIIALTAHATREHMQYCLDSGMNEVLTKPVKLDNLRTTLLDAVPAERSIKPSR